MWKNTVKPAVPLPAARPSVQDSAPPSPLTKFVPRPIKKRSKLLEGCVFNVQWSTHDTRDSFFAYIRTINDLGGIDIKDQTDPRITHYIVVLPHRFPLSKKQFHTWEVAGDWKWQYVIREHAKWYNESERGFDAERNLKEGRTRMVVGREWLKEVIVGQLDPWSALGQGQGLASNSAGVKKGEVIEQEQGRWEICLKSDGKGSPRDGDVKGQNTFRSASVKTDIDPRRPLLSTLPAEREVSLEPSYLFTPPPSADTDIDTDEMDSTAHDQGGVQAILPDQITDSTTTNPFLNSYFTPPPSTTNQPYTYPYDRSVLFTPPPSRSPDLTHAHISPKYELVPLFSIDDPFGYKSIRARAEVVPVDVLDYGSPAVPSIQLDVESDVGEKGLGIVSEAPTQSSASRDESPQFGQTNRQTRWEPAAAPSTPVVTRPGQGLGQHQAAPPSYTITRRICAGGIKRPRTDDCDNVIPPLIKRKSLPMPVPVTVSRARSESGSPLSSAPSGATSTDQNEIEDDSEDEDGSIAPSPGSEIDMDIDTDSDAGLDTLHKTRNEGVQSSSDDEEMSLHEAMLECDIIWTMADMMIERL